MKLKQLFAVIMTVALLLTYLPILQTSAFQPPVIQLVSIDGQTTTTVYVPEGEISYTVIGQSYSSNGKANVTFSIRNQDTQEVTQVYTQWLANAPNSGTFNLEKGTYEAIVTAVDEDGRQSQPYVVTIIVGGGGDVAVVEAEPNPILIKQGEESTEVFVTFENREEGTQMIEVGWKWGDESVWNDVQLIELPGKYNGMGRKTVTFTIPSQFDKQEVVFAADPNESILESNEENNQLSVKVIPDSPDFYLNQVSVTERTDSYLKFLVGFGRSAIGGEDGKLTTNITYGYEGESRKATQVTLGKGDENQIEFTLPLPSNFPKRFLVNINDPNIIYESDMTQNGHVITILDKLLNLAALSITSGVAYEGEVVTTVVTVSNEVGTMDREVDVVLRLDGKEIGRQPVHILPGEEKIVTFTWEAPDTNGGSPVTHQLEAEINPEPRELEEITYDDNIVRASIVILPEFEGKTCPPGANQASATSGYYEYYCNCGVGGCSICIGTYKESITVTPVGPIPATVKAGMGFEYQYQVQYHNDNPNNGKDHGFQEVEAEFDEEEDLPSVFLVPTSPEPQRNETWSMPRAKIQRGQGDTEMIEYLPTLAPLSVDEDEFVDGGNKYYTSFYQKDGLYGFTVTGRRAGVREITYTDIKGNLSIHSTTTPRLTVCTPGIYQIQGSPHDDYLIRRVDPNIPFPQDGLHGWDWDGHESVLYDLAHWWNTYGREKDGVDDEEWMVELD
ncbi:hypothetical protein [Brevibacillus marinus]|uniref:hypothetical protein n=1 Tax=Brevibacillus marinus TaxID=2496837 RepID=UPI000F840F65|nr:hypothetical protein [Brevibacillus marinus]